MTQSHQHCWSDLPVDLLTEVTERLSYRDVLRFSVVCKKWQLAIPDNRRVILLQGRCYSRKRRRGAIETYCEARYVDLTSQEIPSFCITNVVVVQKQRGGCSSILNTVYCCPSSGWLLLFRSESPAYTRSKDKTFFVHNPLRKVTMELELPPFSCSKLQVATLTTTPTSPDCIIFILWKTNFVLNKDSLINIYTITTYNQRDRTWSIYEIPPYRDGIRMGFYIGGAIRDVACADGIFYFLVVINLSEIILGTFDAALQKWVLMDNPSSTLKLPYRPVHLYLVKSDGELLLAVYHQQQGSGELLCPEVYRFDYLSQKNWTRVNNLGGRVLILSPSCSISTPAVGVTSKFANMIYAEDVECIPTLEKYNIA